MQRKIYNDLVALRDKCFSIYDKNTKNVVAVQITENYLSVKINNRCYYFNTDDGEYDGYSDEIDITVMDKKLSTQIEAIFS